MRSLEGKVAIVTGAGRGIGRGEALALAEAGAAVIVNDLGVERDGLGSNAGPAQAVAAEIVAAGGRAVADTTDITDWAAARHIVDRAIESFGTVDILVNNAGISRFSGSLDAIVEEDWARTLAVNLTGTAALMHWTAAHWRHEGVRPGRAIINTASPVGILMSPSAELPSAAYAASKAGIVALTLACAVELADLDVRVNAIAPVARSRISEFVAPQLMQPVNDGFDRMGPENIGAVVAFLASPNCRLTGKVFRILGSDLAILEGWSIQKAFSNGEAIWTSEALNAALAGVE